MKTQIESWGAPDAASPGALRAARTIFRHMPPDDPKVIATAEEIDRESGHVVLLEALRPFADLLDEDGLGHMEECHFGSGDFVIQAADIRRARAAIKQAERT